MAELFCFLNPTVGMIFPALLGTFDGTFHIIVTQVIYTEQPVHFFVHSIFKSSILIYFFTEHTVVIYPKMIKCSITNPINKNAVIVITFGALFTRDHKSYAHLQCFTYHYQHLYIYIYIYDNTLQYISIHLH